jgi:hypothetical protein
MGDTFPLNFSFENIFELCGNWRLYNVKNIYYRLPTADREPKRIIVLASSKFGGKPLTYLDIRQFVHYKTLSK